MDLTVLSRDIQAAIKEGDFWVISSQQASVDEIFIEEIKGKLLMPKWWGRDNELLNSFFDYDYLAFPVTDIAESQDWLIFVVIENLEEKLKIQVCLFGRPIKVLATKFYSKGGEVLDVLGVFFESESCLEQLVEMKDIAFLDMDAKYTTYMILDELPEDIDGFQEKEAFFKGGVRLEIFTLSDLKKKRELIESGYFGGGALMLALPYETEKSAIEEIFTEEDIESLVLVPEFGLCDFQRLQDKFPWLVVFNCGSSDFPKTLVIQKEFRGKVEYLNGVVGIV